MKTLVEFVNSLPDPGPDVTCEANTVWMVRVLMSGAWLADIGSFDSESDCRDYIERKRNGKNIEKNVVRFPICVYSLTVTQAFA